MWTNCRKVPKYRILRNFIWRDWRCWHRKCQQAGRQTDRQTDTYGQIWQIWNIRPLNKTEPVREVKPLRQGDLWRSLLETILSTCPPDTPPLRGSLSLSLSLCLSHPLFPVCWIDVVTKTTKITSTRTGRRSPVTGERRHHEWWCHLAYGASDSHLRALGSLSREKGNSLLMFVVGWLGGLMKETAMNSFLRLSYP